MIPLPDLPYAHGALEPVISEATMRLHHGRHHARYVEVVNGLIAGDGHPATSLEALIRQAALAGERKLFNNAAQAWNHAFFWRCMTPESRPPVGGLAGAIVEQFGGLAELGEVFVGEGATHFGSGWVWLAAQDGRLQVLSTHDADTLVTRDLIPLLVCDLWEHAYYLDHRQDRGGFLQAWWDRLPNWSFAQGQFDADRGEGVGWRHPLMAEAPREVASSLEEAADELSSLLEAWVEPGSVQEHRVNELLDLLAAEQEGGLVRSRTARPAARRAASAAEDPASAPGA
ncbi:superoxide dismutase [Phenylobacterium sp.]|uniref:superoxide dismutase n=1 Tax=Phenylobacterium sp. TaxID=1871053 RepID=UPI002FE36C83